MSSGQMARAHHPEGGGLAPLVSCLCPTFNRYPDWGYLLEEAVESFLRQDYPRKELVIVNDAPGQHLKADFVAVHVINLDLRLPNLGKKYNEAVSRARGELLMPWEDDDISLPWRISQAVSMLGDADYWKPPQVVYLESGKPPVYQHSVGVRHHASIFRRSAWETVGGYPETNGTQDAIFDNRIRQKCRTAPEGGLPPEEWAYIYRWGVSPWHLSGWSDHDALYARAGEQTIRTGDFLIEPCWRDDYVKLLKRWPPR